MNKCMRRLILLINLILISTAWNREKSQKIADGISGKILMINGIDSIDWLVKQKVVYLKGNVKNDSARKQIVSQVRSIKDVDGVIDALHSSRSVPMNSFGGEVFLRIDTKIPDSTAERNYKIAYARVDSSDTTLNLQEVNNISKSEVSEVLLEKHIKQRFEQKLPEGLKDLFIRIEGSVVFLSGKVDSWKQRQRAIQYCFAAGAGAVVSRLKLEGVIPDKPPVDLQNYFFRSQPTRELNVP